MKGSKSEEEEWAKDTEIPKRSKENLVWNRRSLMKKTNQGWEWPAVWDSADCQGRQGLRNHSIVDVIGNTG